MTKRKPQDLQIVRNIAKNLLLHRVNAGLTQTEVGQALNVTFQQEQKFEVGTNCMSACQLFMLTNKFNCNIADFQKDPKAENTSQAAIKLSESLMNKVNKTWNRVDHFSRIAIKFDNADDLYSN